MIWITFYIPIDLKCSDKVVDITALVMAGGDSWYYEKSSASREAQIESACRESNVRNWSPAQHPATNESTYDIQKSIHSIL